MLFSAYGQMEYVNIMKKWVVAIEKGIVIRDEERGKYGYED